MLNEIIGESLDRADPGILGRPVRDLAEREIGDFCGAADFPPLTTAAGKLAPDEAQQVILVIGYVHGAKPF